MNTSIAAAHDETALTPYAMLSGLQWYLLPYTCVIIQLVLWPLAKHVVNSFCEYMLHGQFAIHLSYTAACH